jgi:hypothetical protein
MYKLFFEKYTRIYLLAVFQHFSPHCKYKIMVKISCRFLSAEARVRARVSPYGIYGGHDGNEAGSSVFPCQYIYTMTPYSFILCRINNRLAGGRILKAYTHLVPKSRMSRSYTSSPPSAFAACSGIAYPEEIKLSNQRFRIICKEEKS